MLTKEDLEFIDEVHERNVSAVGEGMTIPEIKHIRTCDNGRCEQLLPIVISALKGDEKQLEYYLGPLLTQFANTKMFHLVCKAGAELPESARKDPEAFFKSVGRGALACYKWSNSATTDEEIFAAVRKEIKDLRPKGCSDENCVINVFKVPDHLGISRVTVGTFTTTLPGVAPKLYVAFTGTRMGEDVTFHEKFRQWFMVNLQIRPVRTKHGWVHGGMYTASQYLTTQIIEKVKTNLLTKIGEEKVEVCIVGHSMGAGISHLASLEIAQQKWCKSCVTFTLATPSVFYSRIVLPRHLIVTNFIDRRDPIHLSSLLYRLIGDTFILKSNYFSPNKTHVLSYEDLFGDFTFAKGKAKIIRYIQG